MKERSYQVLKPLYRTEEILELVRDCCDQGWTGIGGKTIDFEKAWMEYSGAKTCHMLASATVGLHLAVLQLKMKYGWQAEDEIISSPLTFVSTNHAILYSGLKPVFADIDETGCLSAQSVRERITPRTRAILFVGLGGNVGALKEIVKIADEKKIPVILDAAHMAGTRWREPYRHVGVDDGVRVTVFSGQAVKNLPTADAGWICWNGEDAQEMDALSRKLSWLGIDKDTFSRTTNQGTYKWYYDVPYLGFKYHANSIMASFGLVGLRYLDQDNAYRRYLCDIYAAKLSKNSKIRFVPTNLECESSRHLFQIRVESRDEVMLALNQCGIYPGVHYRQNGIYSMYQDQASNISEAIRFSDETISLPLHLHLRPNDLEYICRKLLEVVG